MNNSILCNIIVCVDKDKGIGKDNSIPWDIKQDRSNFNSITTSIVNNKEFNILIMGRNTYDSLPDSFITTNKRKLYVLTTDTQSINIRFSNTYIFNTWNQILINIYYSYIVNKNNKLNKVFIIGGEQIYIYAINNLNLDKLYLTKINKSYNCDRFIPLNKLKNKYTYRILNCEKFDSDITFYEIQLYSLKYRYILLILPLILIILINYYYI